MINTGRESSTRPTLYLTDNIEVTERAPNTISRPQIQVNAGWGLKFPPRLHCDPRVIIEFDPR